MLAPIAHITSVAREIQARELSRRIELDGPDDELKRLADTFDSMLARLDLAFASQRRFVADASHELRTPLAIIKANLDLALTDAQATDESRATAAAVIKRAIDRMARLTDDLLALARLDAPASGREPVPLGALLEDAREEFEAAAAARAVELETAVVPGRIVQGDRDVLKRAVTNLLDNAVRVAPEGSTVRLSHGEVDGWAWLAVADDGPGIAPEHQEWIFDRFWRADDARSRPGRRQRPRARDRAPDRGGAPRLGRRLFRPRRRRHVRRLAAAARRIRVKAPARRSDARYSSRRSDAEHDAEERCAAALPGRTRGGCGRAAASRGSAIRMDRRSASASPAGHVGRCSSWKATAAAFQPRRPSRSEAVAGRGAVREVEGDSGGAPAASRSAAAEQARHVRVRRRRKRGARAAPRRPRWRPP